MVGYKEEELFYFLHRAMWDDCWRVLKSDMRSKCAFYLHCSLFDYYQVNCLSKALTVDAPLDVIQDIYTAVESSSLHLRDALMSAAKFASEEKIDYILKKK